MTPGQVALIAGTGAAAGMINSVAGGGSFLTLPILVACGIPSVPANATSTVALWPGTVASFGAYRREFTARPRTAVLLVLISLLGGVVGAWILLATPGGLFDRLLPWLTLFATGAFACGSRLSARWKLAPGTEETRRALAQAAAVQFVVAVYGGYYGAGAGIMMLAALALQGMKNIHAMNAFKTLLAASFNSSALVLFIWRGIIHWPAAWCLMAGAVAGGYGGAQVARRLPPGWVRRFVLVVGVVTTGYFFWRAYL